MNPTSQMAGPFWPETVRVIRRTDSAHGHTTLEAVGVETGRHYTTTLPTTRFTEACTSRTLAPTFKADACQFALALEGERLRLAAACDPLLAINDGLEA